MIESLLPVTALVAIIVFIAREFFDGWRRWNERDRRKRAVQKLAAINIERNHWAAKSLKDAVSKLQSAIENQGRIKLISSRSGAELVEYYDHETDGFSGQVLAPIDFSFLEENLGEFAIVAESSFKDANEAYDALLELNHVRNSLINNISVLNGEDESDFPNEALLSGFIGYAYNEIENCLSDMSKFYLKCTGNSLKENFRIR